MTDWADQGGEAPGWAHLVDAPDQTRPPVRVLTSNTILYCDRWAAVVDFYRSGLELQATMERDWFVEFEIHPGAHLSVADASHATVAAGNGSGLTLSWYVNDIDATRNRVIARGIEVSAPIRRWDADTFFVFDPAGNRIEFWAHADGVVSTPSSV
jgi:predicted enzyme related to lactoylglutathione lyase